MNKIGQKKVVIWVLISIIVIYSIGQLFPLIWLVDFSFCTSNDLFGSFILKLPSPPQFINYVDAWTIGKYPKFLLNSVLINTLTVSVTVFLSIIMGYAFTRMEWKLRNTCFTIVLLGMMIPIHATLLPNFLLFGKLKLLDTLPGILIPYIAFSMPLGIFIMAAFLRTIPKALEESAIIDGCGIFRLIFQIITPLTKPAIVTVSVMTFINSWNEFIMALTYLNTDKFKTIPFSIMSFMGLYGGNYAAQFAIMTLAALPSLLVYALLNEQITKGVTVGGIKG
ncbi:MAG TPA: carbohydrate ABC transporter permease [Ruminiclostridium sp.]